MAEPDKQYVGDGNDNPGQAAQKGMEAAKAISKASAETAAAGAEAGANAAAATVKAGVEAGKAVSEVAAGTAAGGPWGAIISAAWAMRHTLFKVLICICLLVLFFIVAVISLPSIVFNNVFHTDPETVEEGGLTDPQAIYDELGVLVGDLIQEGHDYALEEAERIIQRGNYDYEFSMEALTDYGFSTNEYDTCYILAAYSAAMEQRGTTKADMTAKLRSVKDQMFPITYVENEKERVIPLTYPTYSATSVTVVTGRNPYTTGVRTYYEETGSKTTEEEVNVTSFEEVQVDLPVYTGDRITGTMRATYYEPKGTKTLTPETEMVKYVEITIHPFDQEVILKAFNIDTEATYNQFNITYREAIDHMAEALRKTLGLGPGMIAPGDVIGTGELIWPVPASGRVTSYYGERIHPITGKRDFHLGIDIGAPLGTPIIASDGGTVVSTNIHYSYGIHCLIDHGNFQQEAALRSVMPFLQIDPKLERKTQRNLLTSGAASSYIFTSYEMSDDNGVLLGINRHNNSLCVVDLFNTKLHKNANLCLLGTSGAGKTFTMQLLARRMRMRGIQCFILAPIKGFEFKRACHAIGGSYIKLSPGSTACINVMEIRPTSTPEMELIDEIDYSDLDSMLARKIQQLMIFFSLLIPDISNEEEQMLDEALVNTYAEFGITHDNDSVYADESHTGMKPMPILGDLHKHLLENPMTKRVATIVGRFVTGSAQSFNRQTNVDLSNKYVVLDLSEMGKLLPVGMMIALDYCWDSIKADRTKRKALFIDEIWQLIGAGSNKQAAEFCLSVAKLIRGFGGSGVFASQDLSDFFALEDGKYGRAIINNSKNKIILNLEPDEAQYVREVLKLSRTELRAITQFERGEALISSNSNKVPLIVKASRAESEIITTDRQELANILAEKQRHQQNQPGQSSHPA